MMDHLKNPTPMHILFCLNSDIIKCRKKVFIVNNVFSATKVIFVSLFFIALNYGNSIFFLLELKLLGKSFSIVPE